MVTKRLGNLQEDQSEGPDLGVSTRCSPLLEVEWFSISVIAVAVDAAKQKGSLVGLEESPRGLLGNLIWEIHDEDVASQSDEDSHDTLDDEDPSPASVAGESVLTSV